MHHMICLHMEETIKGYTRDKIPMYFVVMIYVQLISNKNIECNDFFLKNIYLKCVQISTSVYNFTNDCVYHI
jgi:hypothetical protein